MNGLKRFCEGVRVKKIFKCVELAVTYFGPPRSYCSAAAEEQTKNNKYKVDRQNTENREK